ncbi:hypothetical protein VTP01DRAFT_1668 [Rhizomucor pusillus]|uniref:uncharacterized protein n=1 Tax=Rhizomucor pusillus TaxID=4840 RepID=UPI003744031F
MKGILTAFLGSVKTVVVRILYEEHKEVTLEYVDENPSVVLEQLMERLLQRFEEFKLSKTTLYRFVRKECNLTLKKARFQPVDRNSEVKIQERLDWVRKWDMTHGMVEKRVFCSDYGTKNKSKDDHNLGYIESRGYWCAYLPSYSPELNPMEQSLSVVKSKVKRNGFLENETLMTRIREASNSLRLSDFEGLSLILIDA